MSDKTPKAVIAPFFVMDQTPMATDEFLDILYKLEDYHAIFYKFFEMSSVVFTDALPTAAVSLAPNEKPKMYLNRAFWDSQTEREKLFIVCHECLHVFFDHGNRNGKQYKASPQLVNIAQDITINEVIVDLFGFLRGEIRDWKNYCWIDTCFPPEKVPSIKKRQNFYYYLEKLLEDSKTAKNQNTLDQHDFKDGESPSKNQEQEAKKKIAAELSEELSDKEIQAILDMAVEGSKDRKDKKDEKLDGQNPYSSLAGTLKGEQERRVIAGQPKPLNIPMIVAGLKKTKEALDAAENNTFVFEDRRIGAMNMNVLLPGVREKTAKAPKMQAVLFMDVSYSCVHLFDKFCEIVQAFELHKDAIEVHHYTFDTVVREVEIRRGRRIQSGGGTSFRILEAKCLEIERSTGKYPECVIVITDGDGDPISPKLPKRWRWLLSPPRTTRYIPKESKHWHLEKVVL